MDVDETHVKNANTCETSEVWLTVITILFLVGLVLSYVPQQVKIVRTRTSAGLSASMFLLGTIGQAAMLSNIFILNWSNVQCCIIQSAGDCAANLLGIIQVFLQFIAIVITFALFVIYFPKEPSTVSFLQDVQEDAPSSIVAVNSYQDQLISSNEPNVDENENQFPIPLRSPDKTLRSRGYVRALYAVSLTFVFSLITAVLTVAFLVLFGHENIASIGLADAMGYLATVLAVVQILPQLWMTFQRRSAGALSLWTLLIQAPGAFLAAGLLYAREGTKPSTWLSMLLSGVLQMILLIMCLIFRQRQRTEEETPLLSDE